MATNNVLNVTLDKGLDLVTPPITVGDGYILDCLNYEITDTSGLRRIDGYERYDGYPTGAISEFYRVGIEAVTPENQSSIEPGCIISREGSSVPSRNIGIVVGGPFDTNLYDITPLLSPDTFITEEQLLSNEGGGFLLLESEVGTLRLEGDESSLGDQFVVYALDGTAIPVTITDAPVKGKVLITDPTAYIEAVRGYSAALRSFVAEAPSSIAGLYWYKDRLLAAVNVLEITLVQADTDPLPQVYTRMLWNGTVYRLLHVGVNTVGSTSTLTLSLAPINTSSTVNDDLVEVELDETAITTWLSTVTDNGGPTTTDTDWAYIGYYSNPDTGSMREFVNLIPSSRHNYINGDYPGTLPPPLTLADDEAPAGTYYIVGDSGATVIEVRLSEFVVKEGVLASGTAAGTVEVSPVSVVDGVRDYIVDGDELHSEYPTTLDSLIAVIDGDGTACVAAQRGD